MYFNLARFCELVPCMTPRQAGWHALGAHNQEQETPTQRCPATAPVAPLPQYATTAGGMSKAGSGERPLQHWGDKKSSSHCSQSRNPPCSQLLGLLQPALCDGGEPRSAQEHVPTLTCTQV